MQKQVYEGRNALCHTEGHEWISTASDRARMCLRKNCKCVEVMRNGKWILASEQPNCRTTYTKFGSVAGYVVASQPSYADDRKAKNGLRDYWK